MATRWEKDQERAKVAAYEEWKKKRDAETKASVSTEENSSVDTKKSGGTIKLGGETHEVDAEDCFIWLKNNADHEKPHQVVCSMPEPKDGVLVIRKPFLIAWGLYHLLSDEEWTNKLIERTKVKLEEQLKPITKE
jgi:hypothetical protein